MKDLLLYQYSFEFLNIEVEKDSQEIIKGKFFVFPNPRAETPI